MFEVFGTASSASATRAIAAGYVDAIVEHCEGLGVFPHRGQAREDLRPGAAAPAVLTGWLGYLFGARQERDKERRARDFTATIELVAPLRELQRLLRWFGRGQISRDEVASAFLTW